MEPVAGHVEGTTRLGCDVDVSRPGAAGFRAIDLVETIDLPGDLLPVATLGERRHSPVGDGDHDDAPRIITGEGSRASEHRRETGAIFVFTAAAVLVIGLLVAAAGAGAGAAGLPDLVCGGPVSGRTGAGGVDDSRSGRGSSGAGAAESGGAGSSGGCQDGVGRGVRTSLRMSPRVAVAAPAAHPPARSPTPRCCSTWC